MKEKNTGVRQRVVPLLAPVTKHQYTDGRYETKARGLAVLNTPRLMVRAGISLPALQRLMGHSQIHTTMLYVQIAPQDVWREYARAIENRSRLSPPPIL